MFATIFSWFSTSTTILFSNITKTHIYQIENNFVINETYYVAVCIALMEWLTEWNDGEWDRATERARERKKERERERDRWLIIPLFIIIDRRESFKSNVFYYICIDMYRSFACVRICFQRPFKIWNETKQVWIALCLKHFEKALFNRPHNPNNEFNFYLIHITNT